MTTWIRALVSGKVFNADYQRQWLDSLQAEDPDNPDGQKYGYGISYQRFSPTAAMYYHGGEMPGFNSFMGYDPDNDVSLVIWTNLTISPRRQDDGAGLLATTSGRDLHRAVAGANTNSDHHEVVERRSGVRCWRYRPATDPTGCSSRRDRPHRAGSTQRC